MKDLINKDEIVKCGIKVIPLDMFPDTIACSNYTRLRLINQVEGFTQIMQDNNITIEVIDDIRPNIVYAIDSTRVEEEMDV